MSEEKKIYNCLISKLSYIDNNFNKYKKINDVEGNIYLIENKFHSVYNYKVYLIDCNENAEIFKEKYSNYVEPIKIIKKVKVPYIKIIYEMLLIFLMEQMINKDKKFFIELPILKKELEKIRTFFNKKEPLIGLGLYVDYILSSINKKYVSVQQFIKLLNTNNLLENIKCVNKYDGELKVNTINQKIITQIQNYTSSIRKYGFMVLVESEELKKYYSSKVSYFLIGDKYKEILNDMFIFESEIISTRIYNYELAELIAEDLLKKYFIGKKGYYLCNTEEIKKVCLIIKNYFDTYDDIEDIKKAYLYEKYNIGEKVEKDELINTNVDYVENKYKKISREGKKYYDKQRKSNESSNENKNIECMKTKTRYEMICEKLEKK